jgi:LysR family glycine cleavage system transcriptional activator
MRRVLPPLNPLRSFEAAARHLSFTLAAKELSVSQVAVSRQVAVLEEYLEVALFERGARSLQLTAEGAKLMSGLSVAFSELERAVSLVNMRGRRNVVSVQCYTTFAQWWVIPRLAAFRKAYPEIEVRLTASLEPVNFGRQNLDAAIVSAPGDPESQISEFLTPCHLVPVCSPELIADITEPLSPEDLNRFTILHSLSRPRAWDDWIESAGGKTVLTTRALRFENSAMAFDAALEGMGVAMGIQELVQQHLDSGRLVAPVNHVYRSPGGYYIVRPLSRQPSSATDAFLRWLLDQAQPLR